MVGKCTAATHIRARVQLLTVRRYPEMYMLWGGGGAPFRETRNKSGDVVDRSGTRVSLMGNSRKLLADLAGDDDIKVAVASCTDEPSWADECMRKIRVSDGLNMKECIDFEEIHKASKRLHFQNLRRRTKIGYSDMIFFDNERGNCNIVKPLGVHCVYVPDGMTESAWNEALVAFDAKKAADAGSQR